MKPKFEETLEEYIVNSAEFFFRFPSERRVRVRVTSSRTQ